MLENLEPIRRLRSCGVRTIRESLDEADKKLLDKYVADTETWSNWTLSKALASKGLRVDHKTIDAHRLNNCSCKDV